MIKTFKNKGLAELHQSGKTRHISHDLHRKILQRLDVMQNAATFKDLDLPGWRLHRWQGMPDRWSLDVSGQWRIVFKFEKGDCYDVDLIQPH